jgi:hypothetical protein
MKNIIRKILKEDQRERYLNKIIQVMKNDYPLFHNLKDYGFYEELSEDELIYVLSEIFGEPVKIKGTVVYDKNGNEIYSENSEGQWSKREYENNNRTYLRYSDGYWMKWEYDEYGNMIYHENVNGYWCKKEYDENDNMLYYENSNGEIEDYR